MNSHTAASTFRDNSYNFNAAKSGFISDSKLYFTSNDFIEEEMKKSKSPFLNHNGVHITKSNNMLTTSHGYSITKGRNFFNQKSNSPTKVKEYIQRSTSINARNSQQQVVKLPALYSPDKKNVVVAENSMSPFSLHSNFRNNNSSSPLTKLKKSNHLHPTKIIKEDNANTNKKPITRRLTFVDEDIKEFTKVENESDPLFQKPNSNVRKHYLKQLSVDSTANPSTNFTSSHSSSPTNLLRTHKENLNVNYASRSQPGKNEDGAYKVNQDSNFINTNVMNIENFRLFGVLDGHGLNGHMASKAVSAYISEYFKNELNYPCMSFPKKAKDSERFIYEQLRGNKHEMIKNCFNQAEDSLKTGKFDVNFSGTTSVIVMQIGDMILCANAGDSRAIMVSEARKKRGSDFDNFYVEALSVDHKPEIDSEKKRITMAGGRVEQYSENGYWSGPYRVWVKNAQYPGLAMSRSIGDLIAGSVGVISDPQILEHQIDDTSRYIIIASDGVWEFLDNTSVMAIVNPYYANNDPEGACNALVDESTSWWEKEDIVIDDITVVAIFFNH